MFYEIPVAKPWTRTSEVEARNTIEQVKLGDALGFHSLPWHIASLAEWMQERKQSLGNYQYAGDALKGRSEGMFDHRTMDYLWDSGAGVVVDPDRCIEIAKRYQAVGCDLLMCLFNPYKIPHEDVMKSIELMGKHVLPAFA
jgi:hypothetical protein